MTSVAPRLAQQQRSIELQRRQQEEQRRRQLEQLQQRVLAQQQDPRMSGQLSARQSSAPAGYPRPPQVASGLPLGARGAAQQRAAAAEALARREEEAARQRQLMEQLAGMTRKTLPDLRQQAAAGNLADTVHALAHAGKPPQTTPTITACSHTIHTPSSLAQPLMQGSRAAHPDACVYIYVCVCVCVCVQVRWTRAWLRSCYSPLQRLHPLVSWMYRDWQTCWQHWARPGQCAWP